MYRFEAWSRHVWLWTIPLAFCVLNLLAIVLYQTRFAGRVDTLATDHKEAQQLLEELRLERERSEHLLAVAMEREKLTEELYSEVFSTAAERFTRIQLEVKNLARRAGLRPTAFSYPRSNLDWELIRREITFSVTGTYEQLRMFINLLELSEYFLSLDRVSLSESSAQGSSPVLSIGLSLSTVFVAPGAVAPGAVAPGAAEEISPKGAAKGEES
jgi:Tfp pilus assembly protein PilO